jgi:uncharacterized protein YdeI (YjbR/CyaY-like superfamily)
MEQVPPDLKKVLAADPKAKAQWEALTPIGRRDFISWIDSAKQPETRRRRIESVPSRLASGKRRPCCYAVVPLDVYTALKSVPKAQALWKQLTADEKRNFTDWIAAAADAATRTTRIETSCTLLAKGARHP